MRSAILLAGALIAHAINPQIEIPPMILFALGMFIVADVFDYLKRN